MVKWIVFTFSIITFSFTSSLLQNSMYVCMYVCMYCMYLCMYISMNGKLYVCMYVCMYVFVQIGTNRFYRSIIMHVYMYLKFTYLCMYALYVYNVCKFSITSLRPTDKDMYVLYVWYLYFRWEPFAVYIHALIVGSGGKKVSARAPLVCIFKFTLHHSQFMYTSMHLSIYICMYVCMYKYASVYMRIRSNLGRHHILGVIFEYLDGILQSHLILFLNYSDRSVHVCLCMYVCMYVCM